VRRRIPFNPEHPESEKNIKNISEILEKAERAYRESNIKDCVKYYREICTLYENIEDFCTSSYFHKRCLDYSKRYKYINGEIDSLVGLGKCEEMVFNINKSMEYMQKAFEVAMKNDLNPMAKAISQYLTTVYEGVASEYEQNG